VIEMTRIQTIGGMLIPLLAPLLLVACGGGISANDYNAVQAENQKLRQQATEQQAHIDRLRSAIDYTV